MKNIPENKAKFFAQYWGQNVLRVPQFLEGFLQGYCTVKIGSDSRWNIWVEKGFLELKPLSQITDEEFKDLEIFTDSIDEEGYREGAPFSDYYYWMPEEVDYLRSKGYAFPYMGISVEQQIEWGWVKLKK